MNEDLIKSHMKSLGCTREEAIQLIKDDEETDSMSVGEINRELTPEQRKAIKQNSKTSSGKPKENKVREKKVDEDKEHIIKMLEIAVHNFEPSVVNAERQIDFTYNGGNYSVVLTKHRPSKK